MFWKKSGKARFGEMLIVRLILAMLSGVAAHQTYGPTRVFGARWGSLVRYAIGILLFIPAQLTVKSGLPKSDPGSTQEDMERDIVSGLLAAGAVGTGVLIGHVLEAKEAKQD